MPEAVHRLKDILVEEVSLVDRAANKRRFLLVKREGDMSELRPNGRGGFTRVNKAEDETEDETEKAKKKPPADAKEDDEIEDDETEKAKKKPAFPGAAKPFGAKPKPKDDDEEENDDEDKRKRASAEHGDGEEEDTEKRRTAAKGASAQLAAQLTSLAGELSKLAQKLEDDDDDEPSDVSMKKIIAAHRKLAGMADAYLKRTAKKSIDVVKIGAKMSSGRLSMFKDALQTLQSLLTELMDSPKKQNEHEADAGDPQLAPAGWKAANPSSAPTNATGAAAVKAIAKSFDELLGVVREQATKISKLEKGINPSNALPVDKIAKSVEAAWPMDMNAPPRDKVSKGDSFFDD